MSGPWGLSDMSACDEILFGIAVLYVQNLHRSGSRIGFKNVPCSVSGCSDQRVDRWWAEMSDTTRGVQMCTVKANHIGPAFCSLNCYFVLSREHNRKEKEKENEIV